MTKLEELSQTLSRLSQLFDQNMRTLGGDAQKKGWGQFLEAERQADQIGLYGTCAGVAVKTFHDKDAAIDPGVANFLSESWKEPKYFNQNVRLAFLILALSKTTSVSLVNIREDAARELLSRRLPNGAWSDGAGAQGLTLAPSRITTAWVLLALSRVRISPLTVFEGAAVASIDGWC